MIPSSECRRLIQEFEKCRLRKYQDEAGLWTIGWGHLIKPGENFDKGITQAEADRLFEQDLNNFARRVSACITVTLKQHQFDALVSLAYNIGMGDPNHKPKPIEGFLTSSCRALVNQAKFDQAALRFAPWCKDGNPPKPSRGLKRRRKCEEMMFRGMTTAELASRRWYWEEFKSA